MQKHASDQNKSKRMSNLNVAITDRDRDYLAGDNLQQDIFKWLSPPDPWKNHNIACKSRHAKSAAWFIHDERFSEWKASGAPSPLLWVHGKRLLLPALTILQRLISFLFVAGAGKSVFWYVNLLIIPIRGN